MNVKRIIPYTSLILLVFFPFRWAAAEPELTFHVIAAQPFGYMDEKGEPTGLHYELIQQLSIRSGIAIRPVIMPYNRIWTTLENGGHDGGIVWRSSERDSLVNYLSFVWTDYLTALTLKNKEINQYDDLHSGEVGVMNSSSINERFNNDKKINKIKIGKYENAVTMLAAERIDAVVGNLFAYMYIARRQKVLDKLSLPGFYMGHREQWLQISKKSKGLLALPEGERARIIQKLSVTLEAMVTDGIIRQINRKYYGDVVNQVSDLLGKPES